MGFTTCFCGRSGIRTRTNALLRFDVFVLPITLFSRRCAAKPSLTHLTAGFRLLSVFRTNDYDMLCIQWRTEPPLVKFNTPFHGLFRIPKRDRLHAKPVVHVVAVEGAVVAVENPGAVHVVPLGKPTVRAGFVFWEGAEM